MRFQFSLPFIPLSLPLLLVFDIGTGSRAQAQNLPQDQSRESRSLQCEPDFEAAPTDYQFVGREHMDYEIPADTRVGEVHVTRLQVFDENDPDENNVLFRLANRFHILTRDNVVRQVLLFESGDEYDRRLLQESSRLLRAEGYYFDVDVRPVSLCDDTVDLEVVTRDTWSFMPGVGFDRSGGDNTYNFSLQDSNILGLGKTIGLSRKYDIDRTSSQVFYKDQNLFGSRVRLHLESTESDDGHSRTFDTSLPFFALDSRLAWQLRLIDEKRVDEQFFRSEEVTEVEHDIEDMMFQLGFSRGLRNGKTRRWNVGYQYRRDSFSPGQDLPPPQEFPIDREMSYPFVSYESLEDNFDTAFNLDQIYRTEDIHLGRRLFARLGYASPELGSDGKWLVLEGQYSDTLIYDQDMWLRHELSWQGLWNMDEDRAEDAVFSYEARYFRRQTSHRSFYASIEAVISHRLNTHQQITLGGLNGARAFDNRFQVGDRRIVLTLEERMYTDIHIMNLIRVGGALFIDVGRAWDPEQFNGTEQPWLANIGFGLRLASSKSATSRTGHLDFSFPLSNRDDPEVDSFQVTFNVKSAF